LYYPRTINILDKVWNESLTDLILKQPLTIKSGLDFDSSKMMLKPIFIAPENESSIIHLKCGILTLESLQFNYSEVND
jgi:hypothetical protein